MKKNKTKRLVYLVIVLVLLILVVGVFYLVIKSKDDTSVDYEPYQSSSRLEKITVTAIENSQAVGWIQVEGTNIDYPVIYVTPQAYQSGEDYTWVKHRPSEEEHRLTIFGHNIQNVSSAPLIADATHVRFEQLMSFVSFDFAKKNQYITYTNGEEDEIYKIYAVGFYDTEEDGSSLTSKEEADNYINDALANSIYKYDIDVNSDDDILSLITCTRYFGIDGKTQFKVDARKIRTDENTSKYTVQKTKNYDIIN